MIYIKTCNTTCNGMISNPYSPGPAVVPKQKVEKQKIEIQTEVAGNKIKQSDKIIYSIKKVGCESILGNLSELGKIVGVDLTEASLRLTKKKKSSCY